MTQPNPKARKPYTPSYKWTDEAEASLLATLCEEVDRGRRADSGYKKEAWVEVVDTLEADLGLEVTIDQPKNKYGWYKQRYKEWVALLELSGFGWNVELQRFTAPDKTWSDYVKVHKEAGWHRNHTLHNIDCCRKLFDGHIATGSDAIGINALIDPDLLEDDGPVDTPTPVATPTPIATPTPVTTPLMESTADEGRGEERARKRPKRGTMVDSINNATLQMQLNREARRAEAATQATHRDQAQTTTIRAIKLFLTEYSDMEEHEITRADVFLQLDKGTIRDNWLHAAIEKA
ncbi:hypothetical protein MMC17_001615 [Xylographa soralifera]|nr:hypothetical protein [Xylographa soralifera]